MNGEEFYEHFKDILKCAGVRWSDKAQVHITGSITVRYTQDTKKIVATIDMGQVNDEAAGDD